jgi:hypothetical protein
VWAVDDPMPPEIEDDPLPERARLRRRAGELAEGPSAAVEAVPGARVEALSRNGKGIHLTLRRPDGGREEVLAGARVEAIAEGPDGRLRVTLGGPAAGREAAVDRVLSLTGYLGDRDLHRQLQVHQCYATEGPMKLSAALLGATGGGGDCLAPGGHGVDVLKNPELGFFLLGSKSYGRHSTFLMRAGWEQVDDVFGELAAAG